MFRNHRFYRRSAFFTIKDVLVTSNPYKQLILTLTLKIRLDNSLLCRTKDTIPANSNGCSRFRDLLFSLGLLSVYENNPDFRFQSLRGRSGIASVIIPDNGEEPAVESYVPF